MKFTSIHSKMARAALGLGVRELADLAKVSADTIARLERGEELKERTLEAIQRALEAAGVEFTNGGQPGVRMRKYRPGDIVRIRQAGHVSGIRIEKGQTGLVTVVEMQTEGLGSGYRVTVRFNDAVPLPLSAKDIELVEPVKRDAD